MKNLVFLFLLFTIFGCTEDKDPIDGIDGKTFFSNLSSAPESFVSKTTLPKWLNTKITEFEASPLPSFSAIKIFRGEWKKQTIYFINHPYYSCLFCEIYYEDGEKVNVGPDNLITSKNWLLVFQIKGALLFQYAVSM